MLRCHPHTKSLHSLISEQLVSQFSCTSDIFLISIHLKVTMRNIEIFLDGKHHNQNSCILHENAGFNL